MTENPPKWPPPGGILAIDPGAKTGWCALGPGGDLLAIGTMVLKDPRRRLATFADLLDAAIVRFNPRLLVVERQLAGGARGANRSSWRPLIYQEAIVELAAQVGHLELMACYPSTLKKAITGHGRATKEEVGAAVTARWKDQLEPLRRYNDHELDALALATWAACSIPV